MKDWVTINLHSFKMWLNQNYTLKNTAENNNKSRKIQEWTFPLRDITVPDRLGIVGWSGQGGGWAVKVWHWHLIRAVPLSVATALGLVFPSKRGSKVRMCSFVTTTMHIQLQPKAMTDLKDDKNTHVNQIKMESSYTQVMVVFISYMEPRTSYLNEDQISIEVCISIKICGIIYKWSFSVYYYMFFKLSYSLPHETLLYKTLHPATVLWDICFLL